MKKRLLTLALLPIFVINIFSGSITVMADELESGEPTTATTVVDTETPDKAPSSDNGSENSDTDGNAPDPATNQDDGTGDSTTNGANSVDGETPADDGDSTPAPDNNGEEGQQGPLGAPAGQDGNTDGTTDGATDGDTSGNSDGTDGETPADAGSPDEQTPDAENPDGENPDAENPDGEEPEEEPSRGATRGVEPATVGVDAYAITYANGTMVIQKGNTPDTETYGDVYVRWGRTSIYLISDNGQLPSEEKSMVKTIIVKDPVVGATTFHYRDNWGDTRGFFYNYSGLEEIIDFYKFDTSQITDFSWLFGNKYGSNAPNLTSIDFSQCDFSSATSFEGMFGYMPGLVSVKMPSNTGNLTTTKEMFLNDGALTTVDLPMDMHKVTTMYGMFQNCTSLTTFPKFNWDLTGLTDTSWGGANVFNGCTNLTTVDLSGWTVYTGAYWGYFLGGCNSLNKVSVGRGWSNRTSTSMGYKAWTTTDGSSYTMDWVRLSDNTTMPLNTLLGNGFIPKYAGTWVKVQKTINFYGNGGEISFDALNITNETTDFSFPTATRNGYTFAGWYDSSDNKYEEYDPEMTATSLYAHWDVSDTYTLIIDGNRDGLEPITKTLAIDEMYFLSNAFSSDAEYILTGYNTSADGTGTAYAVSDGVQGLAQTGETVTLYAQWRKIENITVTLHYVNVYDGTQMYDPVTINTTTGAKFIDFGIAYNQRLGDDTVMFWSKRSDCDFESGKEIFSQNGYTFYNEDSGFNYSYNGEDDNPWGLVHQYNTKFNESCDIYAYVMPPVYLRVHYADYVTSQYENPEDIEVKFFGQWYKDGEFVMAVPYNRGNSNDNWTHNNFSTYFSIYLSGSTFKWSNNYVDGLTSNNEFKPEDKFGYVYSTLFAVDDPIDPNTNSIDWSKQIGRYSYNSNYVDDGNGKYHYDYVYAYDYRVNYGDTADIYLMLEPKVVFEYDCEINGQTSTYSCVYPGSGYSPDVKNYLVTYLPSLTRQGYDLVKWVDKDGNQVIVNETVLDLTTNNVLHAVWERNGDSLDPEDNPYNPYNPEEDNHEPVTITFDTQGGSEIEAITVPYNSAVGLGSYIPTKDDYSFLYWYEVKEDGTTITYSTASASYFKKDTTLVAKWGERGYVYFDVSGYTNNFTTNGRVYQSAVTIDGVTYRPTQVVAGVTFGPLPGISVADQRLVGWFDEEGNQLTTATKPALGTKYHPVFEPMTATINENGISFECSAYWANNSDKIDASHLYFANGSFSHTASLHVAFNVMENSNDIPEGNIQIIIPKTIFYANNTDLASELPQYPNTSSEMFFSYKDYDSNNWAIVNNANLSNSSAGLNITINYSSQYTSYGTNITFPVIFMIDTDNDGEFDTQKSYEMNVRVAPRSGNSYSSTRGTGTSYTVWQNSWGSRPEDSDDYFYVLWTYSTSFYCPASDYSSMALYVIDDCEGEVVGYGQQGTYKNCDSLSSKSGYGAMYVLCRYPTSLLGDSGRTIVHNTAKVIFDGEEHIIEAEAVDYRFALYQRDEANFTIGRVGYEPTKHSQNAILNGSGVSGLEWAVKYQNTSPWTSFTDTDGNTTFRWVNQNVNLWMDIGDVYLSSGAGDDYNMWNPACGNIILGENDYEFSKLTFRIEIYDADVSTNEDVAWTLKQKDTYVSDIPYSIYVKRAGDTDWILFNEGEYWGNRAETVNLPEGTIAWKFVTDSSEHFYIRVLLDPFVTLKSSARVKTQAQSDFDINASTVIKLGCHLDLNFDEASMESQHYVLNHTHTDPNAFEDLYEIIKLPSSALSIDSSIKNNERTEDPTNRVSSIWAYAGVRNFHADRNTPTTPIGSGIFYVLLPEASPNPSAVYLIGNNNNDSSKDGYGISTEFYDYEFVNNWQNSGRTMLIVTMHDIKYSQVYVEFLTQRTYQDALILGTEGSISMFFVNTSNMDEVYDNIYTYYGNMRMDRQYYADLYEQYRDDYYVSTAATTLYYYAPQAEAYGLFGSVARGNNQYSSTVNIVPGENYSYKIFYGQSQDTISTNMVIKDKLDGAGTLQSVYVPTIGGYKPDGTATTSKGEVWYSLDPEPDFDNIDTEHGWTKTIPTGLKVYGIVVDYSKDVNGEQFILGNGSSARAFNIVIYEKADAIFEETQVNNTATLYRDEKKNGTFVEQSPSVNTTYATIHLPELLVTLTSNPESGTETAPHEVFKDDMLLYSLKVENRENTDLTDVIVTDNLPASVTINEANILINDKPLSSYDNITVTVDGNKLTVKFGMLGSSSSGRSSYTIGIPCTVNTAIPNTLIVNKGQVISFNGIDLPEEHYYNSNETYHITGSVVPSPTGFKDTSTTTFVIIICIMMAGMMKVFIFKKKRENGTEETA